MDESCHSPRAYFPYYTPFGGFVAPGPSPPISLCSEPILQVPMPDRRSGTPGQPLKSPRIQLLNKTMVDARRKKSFVRGHNINSHIKPLDMGSFFQVAVPIPDHNSESGEGSLLESPQFRSCNPSPYYSSSPHSSRPRYASHQFHLPDQKQLAFTQLENPIIPNYQFQNEQNIIGAAIPVWKKTAIPQVHDSSAKDNMQTWKSTDKRNVEKVKKKGTENNSLPKRKLSTSSKKNGLITSIKADAWKKERPKHKLMMKKQRKQIQQKNKSLHKTELCTHWMLTSKCTYEGKCYFAHGIVELRKRARLCNFKTKPCVDCPPKKSRCSFGPRCNYCHPGEAIRRAVPSTYFDIDYYKDLKKDFKGNEYPFGIFI